MVISLGASGVSHGVTWPVIISRWFRRNRGLATGLAVTGPIFGSPIVTLNAQIEEASGWRVVLIGYGIVVLVGVTLLSMLVRDRPEPYGLLPDGDPPEEGASPERSTGPSALGSSEPNAHDQGTDDLRRNGSPLQKTQDSSEARVPNMVLPSHAWERGS